MTILFLRYTAYKQNNESRIRGVFFGGGNSEIFNASASEKKSDFKRDLDDTCRF